MELSILERRLLERTELDPDEVGAAFIASGVGSETELAAYRAKLDRIYAQISKDIEVCHDPICRARSVFDWLWRTKPMRYESGGNFQLTKVVDAQLDPISSRVGNCLGLTLLYNSLASSFGLEVKAIYLEEAFGGGPHVFSTLNTGERSIDIENILSNGFDYLGHRQSILRRQWGGRELVAEVYNSIGNHFFEEGRLEESLTYYEKALMLNVGHTRVRLSMGIALIELGRVQAAKACFQHAEDRIN